MPELPEVETVRRGLVPVLEGARLARVVQRRADLRWPLPERFAARLEGRRVLGLGRRAKTMLADLDDGVTWLIHLGMTGRVLVSAPEAAEAPLEMVGGFVHRTPEPGPHDHIEIETDSGARLVYNDVRRFGAMDLWPSAEIAAHPWLVKLGPEPLGNAFGGAVLVERLAGKATPVKAALLDQRVVAGLGNIYVCEALHRSGIHPRRIAGSIGAPRVHRLAEEVRATLEEAIAAGGSTLRDYRHADGELGYFQHSFRAYGREGEPCRREGCSGKILRIVQSGRSSFYCSRCQR
ncbi:MAG: bifunctional DNA-formamidopyrimidine glycosylase/DNA-(apurinic or apyrimidinic site) lyase [Pseudomonadota bacterium]